MKFLSAIILLVIFMLSSCQPRWPCEEAPQDGLNRLSFSVTDGNMIVFADEQARTSLVMTDVETGKPQKVTFNQSFFDKSFTGGFSIDNSDYDLKARDSVKCATYILKYRTNDVDTLIVCYKILFEEKCGSRRLESTDVSWNGKQVSQPGGVQFEFALPIGQ